MHASSTGCCEWTVLSPCPSPMTSSRHLRNSALNVSDMHFASSQGNWWKTSRKFAMLQVFSYLMKHEKSRLLKIQIWLMKLAIQHLSAHRVEWKLIFNIANCYSKIAVLFTSFWLSEKILNVQSCCYLNVCRIVVNFSYFVAITVLYGY